AGWRNAFVRLQEQGRLIFSAAIAGSVYAKHGTTFATRLIVIDKTPAEDPSQFPASSGTAPNVATLLDWIETQVPPRLPVMHPKLPESVLAAVPKSVRGTLTRAAMARSATAPVGDPEGVELAYETVDWTPPEGTRLTDAIYEQYGL